MNQKQMLTSGQVGVIKVLLADGPSTVSHIASRLGYTISMAYSATRTLESKRMLIRYTARTRETGAVNATQFITYDIDPLLRAQVTPRLLASAPKLLPLVTGGGYVASRPESSHQLDPQSDQPNRSES